MGLNSAGFRCFLPENNCRKPAGIAAVKALSVSQEMIRLLSVLSILNMKKLLILLTLGILAGCQSNPTPDSKRYKTIMIRSFGEVETLPDQATFHINLACLDRSVRTSKECLVVKSNDLNRKLLSFGIKKADILTTAVDLNKSYTWKNNSRVFEGYSATTMLYVTLRDINRLDEIYTELLENQNLDLGGLAYSHSKLDSVKNEAYVNALKKADVLAEKLLTALPEDKKEILKIGNVEISASLPEPQDAVRMDEVVVEQAATVSNQSVAISKGTVKVNATLYVEYLIR